MTLTDNERPRRLTCSVIRERYREESRAWISDRVTELAVVKAQADGVKDSQSADIIASLIDELNAFLEQGPAQPPTQPPTAEAPPVGPGPRIVQTPPVQPTATAPAATKPAAPAALGWEMAVDPRASLEALTRRALQGLARGHDLDPEQPSYLLIDQLVGQYESGLREVERATEPGEFEHPAGAKSPVEVPLAEVPLADRPPAASAAEAVLLRSLAGMIAGGECPNSAEVLDRAKEADPATFADWSSRGVGRALGRFGCVTFKGHARRDYSRVRLDDLREIEKTYDLDLGLPDGSGQHRPDTTKEQ